MINRQISVNYISAYVKVCANYMCVCEGETDVLSVHDKT